MKRWLLAVWGIVWSGACLAAAVNVEFRFAPFVGDTDEREVAAVPGHARVFVNDVLLGEQDIRRRNLLVHSETHEVAPALVVPAADVGPVLRKGRNTVRIEFEPVQPAVTYHAHLRWATLVERTDAAAGEGSKVDRTDRGLADRTQSGKVVFEREFTAEFAQDRAWHHFAPVTAVTDDDRRAVADVVRARAAAFAPDFSGVLATIDGRRGVDVSEIRSSGCLGVVYDAGLRIVAPADDQIEFSMTGKPEVIVTGHDGALFRPADPSVFMRVQDPEVQRCAGLVLFLAFPPRLSFVHTPEGKWEVVY